jgi:diguanylate cyclase (GGDEF)-like protein
MRLRCAAEAELARGPFHVGFREPLRDIHAAENATHRASELSRICLLGAVCHVIFVLLVNLLVVESPDWKHVAVQCTVTPFLALTCGYITFKPDVTERLREAGALVAALCICLGSLACLCGQPSPTTGLNLFLVSVPVTVILSFMRLRCCHSVALVAVMALALWLVLLSRGDIPAMWRPYPMAFLLAISMPALLAVHRTHCSARQSYLNGLLQGLQIEQLAFENGMLSQISSTDVVTGAANRRQLEDALRLLCAEPACGDFLLLADVDFFKRFNDRHGHLAGDECLREVVTAIKGQLRRTDLVARFGGEEFAVVLPRTTRADAVAAAERIREAVQGHSVTIDGQAKNVTVSIGLAERVEGTTPGMLIGMADGALYAAKRGGRNCVRCAAQVEVGIPA